MDASSRLVRALSDNVRVRRENRSSPCSGDCVLLLNVGPRRRRRSGLICAYVGGCTGARSALNVNVWHAKAGAGTNRRAGGLQVVIAASVRLIIDELWISVDACRAGIPVLQVPVRRTVLVHEIVEVLVVSACQSVLLNAVPRSCWIQPVAIDDVVTDDGVVINDRSRKWTVVITIANQYAAIVVVEHRVVGNRHLIG